MNNVKQFIKNQIAYLKSRKKWKIKFYLNGQYVCSKKVTGDEIIFNSVYVIKVVGKKNLFGCNFVKTVIKPDKLLFKDIDKKEIHVGAYLFEGVEI